MATRGSSWRGTVQCLDCISVNILVVKLHYRFTKCCMMANWVKSIEDFSVPFTQLHVNLQFSQNKKFKKLSLLLSLL